MSITSVTENFTGLGAHDRIQPDGRIMGDGRRFFDVVFDESDEAAVRPMLALADGRVPQLGDSHPYGVWIYVLDRRATVATKSPFVYRVAILYSEIRNPLDEPPQVEWLSASTMEPVIADANGTPLRTSSDEPFDPPPMIEKDDLILRARYNVSTFFPLQALLYKNALNSDYFLGFAPEIAKVMFYGARQDKAIPGNFYAEVAVEIRFTKNGWRRRFRDEGYRTKEAVVDGIQTYKNILDANGSEITEPVMLDGSGQQGSNLLITYKEFLLNELLPFNTEFSRIA